MEARGFDLKPGDHPIVPIMLYDAKTSGQIADELLDRAIDAFTEVGRKHNVID